MWMFFFLGSPIILPQPEIYSPAENLRNQAMYKPQEKGISCWSLNSINFVLFVSERIHSRKQISLSPRLQLN